MWWFKFQVMRNWTKLKPFGSDVSCPRVNTRNWKYLTISNYLQHLQIDRLLLIQWKFIWLIQHNNSPVSRQANPSAFRKETRPRAPDLNKCENESFICGIKIPLKTLNVVFTLLFGEHVEQPVSKRTEVSRTLSIYH